MKSKALPRGIVHIKVYENGVLIDEQRDYNLVVVGGRTALSNLVIGNIGTTPNQNFVTGFGIGTSGAVATDSDTALVSPFTKTVDSTSTPSTGVAQFNFSVAVGEANGTAIQEFGLFTENGDLFARKVVSTINKTAAIRIEATWQIIF